MFCMSASFSLFEQQNERCNRTDDQPGALEDRRVCAHDDSGQGSTTGRLPFELGGTSEREPDGLTPEAERLEKL